MRVLGISNPHFKGVSIATRAICTEYMPIMHIAHTGSIIQLVSSIIATDPDILIIGGWSKGYDELLMKLSSQRKFPVLSIYHSTSFHGTMFQDEIYWRQFLETNEKGGSDLIGFVHPVTARYYQQIKRKPSVFVPHFFPIQLQRKKSEKFTIGIFGGQENLFKNTYGAKEIAADFAASNKNCEVLCPHSCNQDHKTFLNMLSSCSVIVHLSHIECYSNTIQEAWARGIPAIYSPANDGLVKDNPLIDDRSRFDLELLRMSSGIDAMELYGKLTMVYNNWQIHSDKAHAAYKLLSADACNYVNSMFDCIIDGFHKRSRDLSAKPNQMLYE